MLVGKWKPRLSTVRLHLLLLLLLLTKSSATSSIARTQALILRAFETFDAPEIEGQLLSTKHHLTPHFQWNRDPLPSIMDKHEVIIQINSLPHWLGY